jgi:hypothetical protein
MTPREIIAEAWNITSTVPSLRRWAYASSLLETLLNVKLLFTQAYFLYVYLYGHGDAGFFDIEIWIWNSMPPAVAITILLSFILLVVIEFFAPHLCLGAIIGLAAKRAKGEDAKGGAVLGLYNFFPIFTLHEFLILASVPTTITVISLILRYIDPGLWAVSVGGVLLLFLVGNVQKFLFAFAEEAAVIQKLGIFEAIGRSFKLIVSHLPRIMFLYLLLIVISLRIVINAVMVVLIPAIMVGFGFLLTFFLSQTASIVAALVLGVILIGVASYFLGYILAFKQTVWTLTYMEFMKEKDLDVIEE